MLFSTLLSGLCAGTNRRTEGRSATTSRRGRRRGLDRGTARGEPGRGGASTTVTDFYRERRGRVGVERERPTDGFRCG
jgi:hypothetical protein